MSLENKYNLKSPGVKRLMREARELAEPTEEYYASPLDDNLFEWHFTVRGPPTTEFEDGFYHGRILLPSQYPMQPPNIILLTPNGRFEINKKICLSISGHHPESWQPSWSIRTALLALIAFMPTPAAGTIGSLDYTVHERQILARKSKDWQCTACGKISDSLLSASKKPTPQLTKEETSLLQNIAFKAEEDLNRKEANCDDKQPEKSENVSVDDAALRQRIVSNDIEEDGQETRDALVVDTNALNNQNNSGDKTAVVMWIIAIIILILLIRRIFFL